MEERLLMLLVRSLRFCLAMMVLAALARPVFATIQFREIEGAFSQTPITQSYGSSWADFNGDGCLDLFLSNHYQKPTLLANNCDGSFRPVHDEIFSSLSQETTGSSLLWWPDFHGAAWGDFDNDGDPDLLVSTGGNRGSRAVNFSTTNHFWENDEGDLKERAIDVNLGDAGARGRTPNWLDFDGDGLLDIALGQSDPPDSTSVLRLQANGNFRKCDLLGGDFNVEDKELVRSMYPLSPVRMGKRARLEAVLAKGGFFSRWAWKTEGCHVHLTLKRKISIRGARDMTIGDFNNDLRPDFLIPTRRYGGNRFTPEGNRVNAIFVFADRSFDTLVLPDSKVLRLHYFFNMFPLSDVRVGRSGIGAEPYLRVEESSPDQGDPRYIELTRDDTFTHGLVEAEGGGVIKVGYNPESKTWHLGLLDPSRVTGGRLRITAELDPDIDASSLIEPLEPLGRPDIIVSENERGVARKLANFLPVDPTQCNSAAAGDFDNDGDLDVYFACGGTIRNRLDRLYLNDAGKRFTPVRGGVLSTGKQRGIGDNVSVADYDNDGRLDLYVANGYGPAFLIHGRRQLLRNVTENENHWVKFELEGTLDNRDGVGSRVFTKAAGRFQVRYQTGGVRAGVQDSKLLHFGLGGAESVDEVLVQWPNGGVELFGPFDVDAKHKLVQGDGIEVDMAKLPVN